MTFTVRQKGDTLATFRFASVRLMETLARWIPTTPELEVKIIFGRHVWELAQHADMLGTRTGELRLPLQYSRPPTGPFAEVLDTLAAAKTTADRVDGFYRGILPIMEARYHEYLDQTDAVMDEPSVRVLTRVLADCERMRTERDQLSTDLQDTFPRTTDLADQLLASAAEVDTIVEFRPDRSEAPAG
jgi:hypothetical protein